MKRLTFDVDSGGACWSNRGLVLIFICLACLLEQEVAASTLATQAGFALACNLPGPAPKRSC